MPHFGEPRRQIWVPYNGKIADITHADILKHFLDLETALSETRKIIMVLLYAQRIAGTGDLPSYPNEGATLSFIGNFLDHRSIVIADGTQRLQYALEVANDDFDLYCMGYVVEA